MASAQGKGSPEEEAFLKTTESLFSRSLGGRSPGVLRAEVLRTLHWPFLLVALVHGVCRGSTDHSCLLVMWPSPLCVLSLYARLLLTKTQVTGYGPPIQNNVILTNYTCRDLCLNIITSKVLVDVRGLGRHCSTCAGSLL